MHYQNVYPPLYNADPYLTLELPGLIGDIYRDLSRSTDPAIVLSSIVGFVSLLTQGLADVSWSNGGIAPVGTSAGCVARSGSGKSYIYDQLGRAILKKLSKFEGGDNGIVPELLIEDATREAIIDHLRDWPIAGIMSAESDSLVRLFKTAGPLLAKLLNAEEIRHARVGTGRVALRDHRVIALLMIQPNKFDENKDLFGAGSGGIGVINRLFMFKAKNINIDGSTFRQGMSVTTKAEYAQIVEGLIDQLVHRVSHKLPMPVLTLSQDAKAALEYQLKAIHQIQMQLAPDDYRVEYFQRHCERVLRLAGAFHVFNHGPTGQIDYSTFQAAEQIGRISLDAYAELLYAPPKLSQSDIDALALESEIYRLSGDAQAHCFLLKELQRMVINIGMTKSRFNKAVHRLAGSGRFFVSYYNDQEYINIRLQPTFTNVLALPSAFR